MINTKRQAIFTLIILIGAGLLIYDLVEKTDVVYIKIIGLILLMFGLYNSTKQWAQDNPKDQSNPAELDQEFDHTNEFEDEQDISTTSQDDSENPRA